MNITGKLIEDQSGILDVIELDQKYFPRPWSKGDWENLDLSQHLLFKWSIHEQIHGFALFGAVQGDDTAHLFKFLISPGFQGQGVASEFWAKILHRLTERGLKQIYLEVEAGNKRAIGFYQKSGLTYLRTVKSYYSNGSDGLIFLMTL